MSSPSARFFEKSSAGFSKMATRLVSRSTISLPVPSLAASLKSGKSDSLLALASGAMIFLLIWSPMSGLSDHDQPVAANLLDRRFQAPAANQRWVGDTTEFVIGGSAKLY